MLFRSVDWESAWRYAYHVESDLRVLAKHVMEVNEKLLELRVASLAKQDLPVDVVGAHVIEVLRDYLGLTTEKYQPIYAALGGEVYAEDSAEAAEIASLLHQHLDEATGSGYEPKRQEREVLIVSTVLYALAYRADPSAVRRGEFLKSLSELLSKMVERTSSILEILNEM